MTIFFFINFKKNNLGFFCVANLERMATEKMKKNDIKYLCNFCDFVTCKKTNHEKHLQTQKHIRNTLATCSNTKTANENLRCNNCNKIYHDRTGLWRHKKKCLHSEENNFIKIEDDKPNTEDLIAYLIKENYEFKQLLIDQNKKIIEMAKTTGNYNINNNSHNKTFNLQLFLNETCKNAMNITDFVDSLQLQLSDLEKVGEVGYIEGISNIIIKNLNALDVTERPIHCTDKKRETMYIKDEDKWEKENENKIKMHKMIKKVSNKNINLISEFREKYPDYKKSNSKVSDQFNKIIIESMGGHGDNDFEKEEKIIKKIAKEVFVDKD